MHSFARSQLFKHIQLATYMSVGLCIPFTVVAAPNSAAAPDQIETVLVLGEQTKLELEKEQALTPGGVTLIDGDELYTRNVSNLGDMLRYVPGVWAASGSTGDSTFFSSRGSNLDATNYDGNGIKLLQDGLPVTAADGNNHNRAMDPLSARFAVVAHGANALTYGASTLGCAWAITIYWRVLTMVKPQLKVAIIATMPASAMAFPHWWITMPIAWKYF